MTKMAMTNTTDDDVEKYNTGDNHEDDDAIKLRLAAWEGY